MVLLQPRSVLKSVALLPLKAVMIPRVRPVTWVHIGGHGICCSRDHGNVCARAAAESHAWVHGPTAAMVCVDVWGSCYHQRPCGCLGSGAMLASEGRAAAGAVPICVACTAFWGNGDIQTCLLPRIMSESMLHCSQGLCCHQRWGHRVGVTTCDLIGAEVICHHQIHPDLSGLCFHPEPGRHPCLSSTGPKLLHRAISGVWVDVYGPCHLRGPREPCVIESEGHIELAHPLQALG